MSEHKCVGAVGVGEMKKLGNIFYNREIRLLQVPSGSLAMCDGIDFRLMPPAKLLECIENTTGHGK